MIDASKDNNQLYSDLSPTDRVPKIITEYIFPPLEEQGFRILNSGLSIKRNFNQFIQEIWFSRSKWNTGSSICAFTPHFEVILKGYEKWHLSRYEIKPLNNFFFGRTALYLEDWNKELYDSNDYDLAKDNNFRIIKLLNENIAKCGLSFLNTLSNYKTAVDFITKNEHYFLAPKLVDICLMDNDPYQAEEVLKWFRNYERTGESEFMELTIKDIEVREIELRKYSK